MVTLSLAAALVGGGALARASLCRFMRHYSRDHVRDLLHSHWATCVADSDDCGVVVLRPAVLPQAVMVVGYNLAGLAVVTDLYIVAAVVAGQALGFAGRVAQAVHFVAVCVGFHGVFPFLFGLPCVMIGATYGRLCRPVLWFRRPLLW